MYQIILITFLKHEISKKLNSEKLRKLQSSNFNSIQVNIDLPKPWHICPTSMFTFNSIQGKNAIFDL